MYTNTTTAHSFSLTYVPDAGHLIGHWRGTITEQELYLHYAELMATAEAHGNCRFWLLDMRARNWHTSGFGRWFGNEFAEIAHATLGQPLFIAYVLSAAHKAAASSPSAQVTQFHCAAHEIYPFFFDNERAALDWLAHQQELSMPH